MKASQLGMIGQALTTAWGAFKARGGSMECEAEATSPPMEFEGLPCQVVVSVKLIPLVKHKVA